jgi:hypothetical protein
MEIPYDQNALSEKLNTVVIDLLKSKHQTVIPYKNMREIQNVDAGKKFDLEKGIVGGLIWKRHAILTVLKYSDDDSKPQTMALDFMANTKYAQPLIDREMREARNLPSHDDTNNMNKRMQEVLRSAGFTILEKYF